MFKRGAEFAIWTVIALILVIIVIIFLIFVSGGITKIGKGLSDSVGKIDIGKVKDKLYGSYQDRNLFILLNNLNIFNRGNFYE